MLTIQPAALSDEGAVDEQAVQRLGFIAEGTGKEFRLRIDSPVKLRWSRKNRLRIEMPGALIYLRKVKTVSRLCHLLIALGAATLSVTTTARSE